MKRFALLLIFSFRSMAQGVPGVTGDIGNYNPTPEFLREWPDMVSRSTPKPVGASGINGYGQQPFYRSLNDYEMSRDDGYVCALFVASRSYKENRAHSRLSEYALPFVVGICFGILVTLLGIRTAERKQV